MVIDLRYIIPFFLFFAPGLAFLIGALLLGYSLDECREAVAVLGGIFGLFMSIFVAVELFFVCGPIHFTLFEGRE